MLLPPMYKVKGSMMQSIPGGESNWSRGSEYLSCKVKAIEEATANTVRRGACSTMNCLPSVVVLRSTGGGNSNAVQC